MKRLLVAIVLLVSVCGCITDGENDPPTIDGYGPTGLSLASTPYSSLYFEVYASDPNGDDLAIRWYVDDELAGEGDSLSFEFDEEKVFEVKAVVDDGEYIAAVAWSVDVGIDIYEIMDAISELRGLEFLGEVPFERISREDMTSILEEDLEEMQEDLGLTQSVLEAFHVWDGGSLAEQVLGYYATEAEGFYDYADKKYYLIDEEAKNPSVRMVTLAHELTHVLQDQHYDIAALIETDNDDSLMAYESIIEGDATLVEYLYLYSLSEKAVDDYFEYYSTPATTNAKQIISDLVLFPYVYGFQYLNALAGGDIGYLDTVYQDLPDTTEQIMHPTGDGVGTPDELGITAFDALPLLDDNVLGEASIFIFLDQHLREDDARSAAAGWNGDRYAYYGDGEDWLLCFSTSWDSSADAEEFARIYIESVGSWGLPLYSETLKEAGKVLLESDGGAVLITWEGAGTRVVITDEIALLNYFI